MNDARPDGKYWILALRYLPNWASKWLVMNALQRATKREARAERRLKAEARKAYTKRLRRALRDEEGRSRES